MRSLPYNLIKNPYTLKLLQNTRTSFDNSVSPVYNFQIGRVNFYQHIESWFLLKNIKTIYIALILCSWKQVIHNFRLTLALLHLAQASGYPTMEVLIYTLMLSIYSQTTNSKTAYKDVELHLSSHAD